jgi:hypothetical protein
MPGCCIDSRCISCRHDAAKGTKNRSDEGSCHYRPVVTLTHSAWLVIRSLPVFGYAVARAYAGHTDRGSDAGATTTYVRATLSEVATALSALTGEPHPLAMPGGGSA